MLYGRERRESKRISHVCEVQCEGEGISRLNTRINDLSTTGAFIDSMACFAVGTRMRMKFSVRGVPIEVTGEVRYSMPQIGMGIRFVDMKLEHLALLENLIEGKPLPSPVPTLEPPRAAPRATGSLSPVQNMLLGNFAVVSLFDVIQIIENNRLTGALLVTLSEVSGEVHFNEGQIVGATAGADSATDALIKFLGATEGMFEFNKSDEQFERTIETTSNTALVLDLLRAKDEEEAGMPSF